MHLNRGPFARILLRSAHPFTFLPTDLSYTTAPNRAPTAAVSAIASAPQNVTLKAAFVTGAPPACAPNPPRIARNKMDVPATTGISAVLGVTRTVNKGMAAPTAKVPAEAKAA